MQLFCGDGEFYRRLVWCGAAPIRSWMNCYMDSVSFTMTLLFHTLHPSVSSSLLIQEKECAHCAASAKPISVLHSLVCRERGGGHKRCPARHVQVPHPTGISSLFAVPVHWAGGWQQRRARWFHPPVTSQRPTVRRLSQSAGFHSGVHGQRRSDDEGIPAEKSPLRRRGEKCSKAQQYFFECNCYAVFKSERSSVYQGRLWGFSSLSGGSPLKMVVHNGSLLGTRAFLLYLYCYIHESLTLTLMMNLGAVY